MSHYMTNFSALPGLTLEETGALYEKAICATGFDIVVVREPMPKDPSDPDDEFYDPRPLRGTMWSLLTRETTRDHSPFWREVERLEKEAKP